MHGIGLFDPNMGAGELMSEGVSSLMLMPHISGLRAPTSGYVMLCLSYIKIKHLINTILWCFIILLHYYYYVHVM
jgi:hypothetical protein